MTGTVPFPDRDTVAEKLAALSETDKSYLSLLMENPAQDDNLLAGLYRHLDIASSARLLNSLKLETLGKWIGEAAPDRLQIRHGSGALQPAPGLCRIPDRADPIRRPRKSLSDFKNLKVTISSLRDRHCGRHPAWH
jgi:hypothetical protein